MIYHLRNKFREVYYIMGDYVTLSAELISSEIHFAKLISSEIHFREKNKHHSNLRYDIIQI